jgi:hypothetical protein
VIVLAALIELVRVVIGMLENEMLRPLQQEAFQLVFGMTLLALGVVYRSCAGATSASTQAGWAKALKRNPVHRGRRRGDRNGWAGQPQRVVISKSSLRAPHSGQVQFIGTSAQRVPGAMPSSGAPASSS